MTIALDKYKELAIYYNITPEKLKTHLDKNFTRDKNILEEKNTDNIILPFCGKIIETNCKAVIYNHGLYTQCEEKQTGLDICKKCKNLKYGRIEDRASFKKNSFKYNGKLEIPYEKFIKKMNYDIDIVKRVLDNKGLTFEFETLNEIKNNRGRPKKVVIESDSEEEIEVEKIKIDGKDYLKTSESVLLTIDTYDIVGIYKNGNIEKVNS